MLGASCAMGVAVQCTVSIVEIKPQAYIQANTVHVRDLAWQ